MVIFGGFLAWWVRVYASNRVTRNQALLPIAIHYERLTALAAALKSATAQFHAPTPNISGAIADWIKRLDISSLEVEYNLPRKTPSPFSPTPAVSSNYTSFLTQVDAAVILLTIFVKEGVVQVVELTTSGRISSPQAPQTISSIDSLYKPGLTPDAARTGIGALISKAQAPTELASPQPAAAAAPLSLNQLLIEIRRLNITAWCVLLAAAAIGTIITIVLKPDFGQLSDYLLCFTTSFGIPIVGSVAIPAQATTATVTNPTQGVSGSRGLGGM